MSVKQISKMTSKPSKYHSKINNVVKDLAMISHRPLKVRQKSNHSKSNLIQQLWVMLYQKCTMFLRNPGTNEC